MTTSKIKTGTLYRDFSLQRDGVDQEARTVPVAFSSEEPYERYFGTEILDHGPKSVRLDRLASGCCAFLLDHRTSEQIGVIEKAWIDKDRVGRAIVRFSRSARAEEIFQDVVDGIRSCISVGYIVHKMVLEEAEFKKEVYRVTDWEPMEISLVAVPADPTVGVGRSAGAEDVETIIERPEATPPAVEVRSQPTTPTPERVIVMDDNAVAQGRQAEQKRTADLLAIADSYEKFGAREMVADFIRGGKTVEQFKDALMEKISSRHSSAAEAEIGLSAQERKQYSILRAVQAQLSGDWSKAGLERAASEAVAKRAGMTPEGFFVPVDSFTRSFAAGTAAEGGNLIQTSVLGNEFVDVLRNNMVLAAMGVRFLGGLTGNIAIPRKTSGSTVNMPGENGNASSGSVATNQIALNPKRVTGKVPYSKQALLQGSLDVDAMLRDDLTQTIAVKIQDQAINGTATGNEARGLLATAGIGSVIGGTNGAQIDWSHIVGLETACANANAEPDQRSGYIVNTKTRGWLKQKQKAANLPFIWENAAQPLNGYRAAVTNTMSSTGTKGTANGVCSSLAFGSDWSDLVIGLFGGLDIVVDPYTAAGTGEVILTANQYIDVAVRLAASFSAMTDGLTS
ncbi:phage major capsid protein [Noviherbaspirillum denitrificans]|uniref:Phage major capsid protein n=1 Tax=Noviherbaspirillum denitrificans TaxID=1968433 RepID=A0A254T9Q6_9BURK|nr:phage major capsid protein [Noviherbaspirillum denitrificans]OWW18415.1 hypothetical protein AYR66_01025 [Noviherbaspirillum denitrificans]OWW19379.1 hypothetical protein AYR66_07510 [Noviherbaspirillum denitrificans]